MYEIHSSKKNQLTTKMASTLQPQISSEISCKLQTNGGKSKITSQITQKLQKPHHN